MKNNEIEKIKEEKKHIEQTISALIGDFANKYHVDVLSVDIDRLEISSLSEKNVYEIKLDVRI